MGIRKVRIDISGEKYNLLTAIKWSQKDKWGKSMWLCKCECGNETIVRLKDLRIGGTKSCGCLNKKLVSDRFRTLRADHPKLYGVYKTMVNRCYRKNVASYKNYGGRGIKVCEEWLNSFETFCKWCLDNGYQKGLTIDRINVDGDYTPSNCKFADRKEQGRNRRITVKVTVRNVTKPATEWAEIYGINVSRIYSRIKNGVSAEDFILKIMEDKYAN